MNAKELIAKLDQLNALKWNSLKGTEEECKHCGLGIPMDTWQGLRNDILEVL